MTEFMESLFKIGELVRKANINNFFPDVFQNVYVPVIGYNSKKFDMNMIISNISEVNYKISNIVGSSSCYKQVIISKEDCNTKLQFIDASSFVAGGSLKKFVENFGNKDNNQNLDKGLFPYESINNDNYNDVL